MTELSVCVHNDWFTSGWALLLPPQAFPVGMLVATASANEFTGSLDDVLREAVGGEWHLLGGAGDLDAELAWWETDAEGGQEQRDLGEARRERFEGVLGKAGHPVPRTSRDLAGLFVRWGIAERHLGPGGERWTMPSALPLPQEVLPLPADLVVQLDESRWREAVEPAVQRLVTHLVDELGRPDDLLTSIGRLAKATGQDPVSIRVALVELTRAGDVRLHRGDASSALDAEKVQEHARFHLTPDWDHFHEHRVTIHRSVAEEERGTKG